MKRLLISKLLLYIVIMLIFSLLAVWQVHRAKAVYLLQPNSEYVSHNQITIEHNLKQATLQGEFMPFLFIQPRSYHHQPGYLVWAPFKTDNKWILISLGFMLKPEVPNINTLTGTIRFIPPPFKISQPQHLTSFPVTVGQLDIDYFSSLLPQNLEPYVIIADGAIEQVLQSYSEEKLLKHINYAIQFFLIGIALCIGINQLIKQYPPKAN
jgi:cytochrome oxidase assembly protein ShyY1